MSATQDAKFRNGVKRWFFRRPGLRRVTVTRAVFPGPSAGASAGFDAATHYPTDDDAALYGMALQAGSVVYNVWVAKPATFRLNEQDWLTDAKTGQEHKIVGVLKRQYPFDVDGQELVDRVLCVPIRTETDV